MTHRTLFLRTPYRYVSGNQSLTTDQRNNRELKTRTLKGYDPNADLPHETRGFSPYDALATATRNVGEFLGDSTTGRVARGARADLVLVDGNPLDDLRVLRHPAAIMINGNWLDRNALDRMLERARQ